MKTSVPAVCIHGHFYQPPRENPWSGRVEREPSASPFHDWNSRITAECYRPALSAPILDGDGAVVERVNCWEHISFNVGPTLLRWLEMHARDVHDGIVAADRAARERTGHGCAMAQGYHHAILPLASDADKRTEILWGIADFQHRFGRRPEGIWLPETAVDTPTLEAVVDAGLQFVVLAPRQVDGLGPEDLSSAVRVELPRGRSVAAFFYDGAAAQGVAFDGWLHDGEKMAQRLAANKGPLVHLATDGESYGHHHRHGEMALAYAIRTLKASGVPITSYAGWLAENPPVREARIVERSSWSCDHGVGRWSANCGCAIDPGRSGHHQWRATVRGALNRLRDRIDDYTMPLLERSGTSGWALRDRYVEVLLEPDRAERYEPDQLELLEVQRHRLMMFTSCGWFFDDPRGLETSQILRYAIRATQLLVAAGGPDLLPELERELGGLTEGLARGQATDDVRGW